MQLLNLKLRGFIGIKKGLGLDEIELDFSDLTGLVALSGPNGYGKTTILDNLHPYAMLASRNNALAHHVFLRDSFRELTFQYNGITYRTLIKIDAQTSKSEGFIWENDQPKVDGKITEYKKRVKALFGSPELFFNSVFCAQNSKKLSDLTTGKLKELFTEFLRLDRLVEFEATGKRCAGVLFGKSETLKGQHDKYVLEITEKTFVNQKLEVARKDLRLTNLTIENHREGLKKTEKALAQINKTLRQNALAAQRVRDLIDSQERINKDIAADEKQSAKELHELRQKVTRLTADITTLEVALKGRDRIKLAVEDVKHFADDLAVKNKKIQEIKETISDNKTKATEADQAISRINSKISLARNDPEIQVLKTQAESLKEKTTALDKKDPACTSRICSFIVDALKAEKALPTVLTEIDQKELALDNKVKKLMAQLSDLEGKWSFLIKQGQGLTAALDIHQEKAHQIENNLEAAKQIAEKKSTIDDAQARIDVLTDQKEKIFQEGIALKASWEERISAKRAQANELQVKIEEIKATIDNGAEKKAADTKRTIDKANWEIEKAERELNHLKDNISAIEKQAAEIEAAEKAAKNLAADKEQTDKELSEWTYIQKAVSKDGLRALEIDSVAPVITGHANELLHKTFGPTYSVKFLTQDPETGREILDIIVIREDGDEVLLENLSGGEKVWSLKALRLAMTLLSKEKSGRNFETVLADEEDGQLDVLNAGQFVKLYRAVMEAGGFGTCFFISHKPECVSMADHVLQFGAGGITVE